MGIRAPCARGSMNPSFVALSHVPYNAYSNIYEYTLNSSLLEACVAVIRSQEGASPRLHKAVTPARHSHIPPLPTPSRSRILSHPALIPLSPSTPLYPTLHHCSWTMGRRTGRRRGVSTPGSTALRHPTRQPSTPAKSYQQLIR